jgi:hypothetical protein
MLPGEKFKLDTPTIGLAANRRRQVLIPAASIIEIVSIPNCYQGMVDVLWQGRILTMFALDVDVPVIEIAELEHLGLSARAWSEDQALYFLPRFDFRFAPLANSHRLVAEAPQSPV